MEEQVFYFLGGLRTPFLDWLMSGASGSIYFVVVLVVLYTLYRRRGDVPPLLCSVLLTAALVMAVKETLLENRPCSVLPIQYPGCDDPQESFPSMHAAFVATPLVFLMAETPTFVVYLVYVLLVGVSRVYLGMHYPHDVLAGGLIGVLVGVGCLKIKKFLVSRNLSGSRRL